MSKHEIIKQELSNKFGSQILLIKEEYDILIVEVEANSAFTVLEFLKNDSSEKLSFLTTLCGIHYPNHIGKELGVMYQVKNILTEYSVRIKAFFPISEPQIQSVVSLFPTANWMERQEFDFYGINFIGHPDLRRILNVDDMDYHPMRKEFKLEDGTREDKEDKYFGRS